MEEQKQGDKATEELQGCKVAVGGEAAAAAQLPQGDAARRLHGS